MAIETLQGTNTKLARVAADMKSAREAAEAFACRQEERTEALKISSARFDEIVEEIRTSRESLRTTIDEGFAGIHEMVRGMSRIYFQ